MLIDSLKQKLKKPAHDSRYQTAWQHIHIDITLLSILAVLCAVGLFILYSASDQNLVVVEMQIAHLLLALIVMFVFAQIPPVTMQRITPVVYGVSLTLLILVLCFGHIGKGAQRWLNAGFMHFQPSELMKLALPMMLAWYYQKIHLPISSSTMFIAMPILLIPVLLVAKQPDLGTAILLFVS